MINLINVKVDSAFFASLVSASSRFLLPAVMQIKKICHHSARKKKFNLSLVFKKNGVRSESDAFLQVQLLKTGDRLFQGRCFSVSSFLLNLSVDKAMELILFLGVGLDILQMRFAIKYYRYTLYIKAVFPVIFV